MNRWLALLALFVVATPAIPQKMPDVARTQVEPAGQWTVEYADWKCVLHRQFSSAGKRTLFSLSLEPLTSVGWTKIATEGAGGRRDDGDAVMFVDGQRRAGFLHYNIYDAGRYRMREYMLDLERHDLGGIEERVRFWTQEHGDIEVQVNGFPAAWKELGACMTDLYADLGISTSEVAQMVTEPKGDIFSFVDFPRGRSGLDFVVLYWVTAEGRVDECRLLQPSGVEPLDNSLCSDLKRRARFKPARTASGEAIRAPRFENVRIRTATVITTEPLRTPKK